MSTTKRYSSIDFYKLLMAFLVIVLHTSPFIDFSKVLEVGLRDCFVIIAVPFFFATSGFFALRSEKAAKQSIRHLLQLYLIWSIIYLPFSALKLHEVSLNSLYYIKSFFLWGSYDTIWYLLADGVAVAIAYVFLKKDKLLYAFAIGLVFYIIALFGTSYAGIIWNTQLWTIYEWYYSVFNTFKNGLCFGLVFVSLGGIIAKKMPREKIASRKMPFFAAIALAFVILESMTLVILDLSKRGVDMKFSLLPFTALVLIFLAELNVNVKKETALHICSLSTLAFLTQRIFLDGYFWLGIRNRVNSLAWFVIILISTFALSELIIVLSKHLTFLRKIY